MVSHLTHSFNISIFEWACNVHLDCSTVVGHFPLDGSRVEFCCYSTIIEFGEEEEERKEEGNEERNEEEELESQYDDILTL